MKWLAFLMAGHAFAASLPDLQATAGKLRAQRSEPSGWRGESPLLTEFKHQLRDWVESQLNGEIANPQSVSRELNKDLAGAGLTCPGIECEDQSALGYLGDIRLDGLPDSAGWLVLITSVGIACGNAPAVRKRAESVWRGQLQTSNWDPNSFCIGLCGKTPGANQWYQSCLSIELAGGILSLVPLRRRAAFDGPAAHGFRR